LGHAFERVDGKLGTEILLRSVEREQFLQRCQVVWIAAALAEARKVVR
jgi:hypothetical protein